MTNFNRFLAALIAISICGCQLTPTFTTGYQLASPESVASPINETLAVTSFQEDRPPRLYSTSGKIFLTYIPLIPYVSMPFERLDESIEIQSERIKTGGHGMTWGATQNVAPDLSAYTYPNSFARAIAEDLKNSGMFSNVEYIENESPSPYRYVLSGRIRETPLTISTTSYGLGIAGVLLWLLPIPISKTSASCTLDLTLTDQETNSVVWQETLTSEISRLITLYTSSAMVYGRSGGFSFNLVPPPSDSKVDPHSLFSWHFETLRRSMEKAKKNMESALSKYEQSLAN